MSLEKLYTIEVNDAVNQDTECVFCDLENLFEKQALEFTLGSSYMESTIREQTDQMGFCRYHIRKMYDYGNALGNAWILKTRLKKLRETFEQKPAKKKKLFSKIRPSNAYKYLKYQEDQCFLCKKVETYFDKMMESFLYLLINDETFMEKLDHSKGFCMRHFPMLLDACESKLSGKEKDQYIDKLFDIMNKNLERIQKDIDWFIEKFDYRNEKEDWKTSKDALPRTILKINGVQEFLENQH